MKKHIILGGILLLSLTIYSYDGSGGASLNRSMTIDEYSRLVELSDRALESNDREIRDEAVEGIEDFLHVVDEYREVSSKGAKKFLDGYEEDLTSKLKLLNEIK